MDFRVGALEERMERNAPRRGRRVATGPNGLARNNASVQQRPTNGTDPEHRTLEMRDSIVADPE